MTGEVSETALRAETLCIAFRPEPIENGKANKAYRIIDTLLGGGIYIFNH